MKHIKTFESFLNEASHIGRAWSGKLSNIDDLLSWMYDKGILNKSDKDLKDRKFREYYRYYNDGDIPSGLQGMNDTEVESYLERSVEDFIKSMLSKYAGKYDRKTFQFDKLLGQYYGLQNNIKFDPAPHRSRDEYDEVFDYNINSFLYFYEKLGKVDPVFDKLVGELKKQFNDFSKVADKVITDYRKANPDIPSYDGPSTGKIFNAKIKDITAAGIMTPELERKIEDVQETCDKLYVILGNVIEATIKAKNTFA
jgi:hypothetical protein